jgi:sugar phosphate isomerase/epimerase
MVVNLIGFFEWASPDQALRAKGLKEARRCFQMAQRVGCRKVAAPPWGIHTTHGLDLFEIAERYAGVIDLGKAFDVTPVLEFWGVAQTLGHLGEALQIAAECGRPEACILADVFHIFKSSGHFDGLRLLGPNSLGLVHVNDYPGKPEPARLNDSHRVFPGDGVAPLRQIFKTLKEVGYQGTLSLELFNETYWKQDPLSVARTGLKKMKALAR